MIWLVSVALAGAPACTGTLDAELAELGAHGSQASYLCLIADDAAHAPLLAAIIAGNALATPTDAESAAHTRDTRALTLWLVARSDVAWDAADVRLLSPDDRRLLADGVKARRGRKSPAPEHDAIFAQQRWYQVDAVYSDNRLTKVETDNIALANKPPPVTVAAVPVVVAPTLTDMTAPPSACSCTSAGSSAPWWLATLALVALRRRRA